MESTNLPQPPRATVAANLLVIIGGYLLLVIVIQIGVRLRFDLIIRSAQVLVGLIGVLVAWRLNARAAAYIFLAFLAFSVPLAIIRALFGLTTAQGRETHLAVLSAAVLGVAFGAWNRSRARRA